MIALRLQKVGKALTRETLVTLGCAVLFANGVADPVLRQQTATARDTVKKHQTARERAWQTLHEGLTENAPDNRAKAVNALGALSGNEIAEKAANEALQDEKYQVRVAAATALGSMHAKRSIPQLGSAIDDREATVV